MNLASAWLITGILLIVSEFIVPGFIIIFFGFGALLAAAVAAFTDVPFLTQGYIFLAASLLSLVIGKLCFRKTLSGKRGNAVEDADDDGLIGAVAVVTQAIEPPKNGRVEVHGSEWNATASRAIAAGTTVTIRRRDNITLTVE